MRWRLPLLPLLLAFVSLPATAQTPTKIVIGDGVTSEGSATGFTGSSHLPFAAAMAALESSAGHGTIEVMPGTYTFSAQVVVQVPGVRISGGPSAIIESSTPRALFLIKPEAPDFVLDGVTLRDHRSSPPPDVFLDVQAQRFSMLNCRVEVSSADKASPSRAISIKPAGGPGQNLIHGALIQGNVFTAGRMVPGEDPKKDPPVWVQADGRIFLRAQSGRNLRINANTFLSGATPANPYPVLVGNALLLIDEEYTAITGNTFHALKVPTGSFDVGNPGDPRDFSLIASTYTPGLGQNPESTHLTITGNFFELCQGPVAIGLQGAGFSTITGNVFGRMENGAILLKGGTGNVISGNGFHNVGKASPSIYALKGQGLGIHSNSFSLPRELSVRLDEVTGALVNGNQFIGTPDPGSAYMQVDHSTGVSVVGNRFEAGATPAIKGITHVPVPPASGDPILICANIFGASFGAAVVLTNYDIKDCGSTAGGNPTF